MKNITKSQKLWSIVTIGIIGFIFMTTSIQAQTRNKFIMGWEPWPPFYIEDANKQLSGFDIELVEAIMKNAKMGVKFRNINWKRHLHELERGKVDIAASAGKTAEREKYAFFSDPYRTESAVLFVRKGEADKFKFESLKQLLESNFRLGVTREYYYGETYANLIKNPKLKKQIDEVHTDHLNIRKLMAKRTDGFLMEVVVGTALLKKEGLMDKMEIHPLKIYSDSIYVMFSKKSTPRKIVNLFNKSLKELKANGDYDKIAKKYIKG